MNEADKLIVFMEFTFQWGVWRKANKQKYVPKISDNATSYKGNKSVRGGIETCLKEDGQEWPPCIIQSTQDMETA